MRACACSQSCTDSNRELLIENERQKEEGRGRDSGREREGERGRERGGGKRQKMQYHTDRSAYRVSGNLAE